MKYITAGVILAVGISLGFLLGRIGKDGTDVVETPAETEFITEYVTDTVIQKQTILVDKNASDTDTTQSDSLDLMSPDSMLFASNEDTLQDEDLHIHRERKIAERTIPLIYLAEKIDNDSTIKELLGIQSTKTNKIAIEFWESPLNYSGYKLSRKKLILFDMSPQLDYTLYRREDDYYLRAQEVFYIMQETSEFKSYKQVEKAIVFND